MLGYCVLPLYVSDVDNGRSIPRIVADGSVQLPMATHLAPNYLAPDGDAQSKVLSLDTPHPQRSPVDRQQASDVHSVVAGAFLGVHSRR